MTMGPSTMKTEMFTLPEGDVLTWPHAIISHLTSVPEEDIQGLIDAASAQRDRVASGDCADLDNSPEALREYARGWQGAACHYDDSDIPAEDQDWRLEQSYPLERLLGLMEGGRDGWIDWFRTECQWAYEDGRRGYADLLLEQIEEEVILVELEDGRVDCWDGWHRLGAAIVKGDIGIPAVVGVPKPELKLTPR